MSSGGIYMGKDDYDDDEDNDSLDSPTDQLEPKFADPSSSSSQLQVSNSSGLSNSGSLLHSTIEEDKEYVASDTLGNSSKIAIPSSKPQSPKDNWRSGSPFVILSPIKREVAISNHEQQSTSQAKKDSSAELSSSAEVAMSREHLMDRSSSESTISSQGRVSFYGLTKAIKTDDNNLGNSRSWRNVTATSTGSNNSSGRLVGRRTVTLTGSAASSASSFVETKQTAKQQAVQQALLKQGKNPLTLASTLQSSSARSMGMSFVGGVGTTSSGAPNREHSESNYSDPDILYEVNVTKRSSPGSRRFSNILGRSPGNRKKPSYFSDKLHRRTRLTGGMVAGVGHGLHQGKDAGRDGDGRREVLPSSESRRYKVGDNVLVRSAQSKWANLVNRYGFPPSEGETPEERRGPYCFFLAKVKLVHYEEIHPYYTVTRFGTGVDERADAHFMEPLRTHRGEMAALRAATSSVGGRGGPLDSSYPGGLTSGGSSYYYGSDAGGTGTGGTGTSNRSLQAPTGGKLSEFSQSCCFYALLPFLWVLDCIQYLWVAFLSGMVRACSIFMKRQAELFLYGNDPYVCAMRFTAVNFVVLCSTWFLFSDQIRLAFFPSSADFALAVVNLIVWCVLVIELLFQVFIRPEGYPDLIVSEKAFAPSTVRYINAFHLFIESLSLGIFISEFTCLFSGESCGKCLPFSFCNAAKIGIIGPTSLDVFYGHMFVALIRLRVFSMVRHWRNYWLAKTFVSEKSPKQSGRTFLGFKPGTSVNNLDQSTEKNVKKIKSRIDEKEQKIKDKDADLTNASHIGTALMVTNSYRVLACAWVITGFLPVVYFFLSTAKNDVAYNMTDQLQATNLVASDTSSATCNYLFQSTVAWITSVVSLQTSMPYLLTVDIRPYRCQFDGSNLTHVRVCQLIDSLVMDTAEDYCAFWSYFADAADTIEAIADATSIRQGSIIEIFRSTDSILTVTQQNGTVLDQMTTYAVTTRFDQTFEIAAFAFASLLLQLCLLLTVIGGLSTLRRDAEVFVLGPLRRMLKIVARYARNPLVPPKVSRRLTRSRSRRSWRVSQSEDTDTSSDESASAGEGSSSHRVLGSFETEQLITAVAKITDLLRKCWGVAGADIISTNLATREGALTEVFNPTVPGQSVYALFAFAAIGGFDNALRNLGGDIMPLINDVAAVLHGEVFRWGFGDSGQCNKNLGGAFLMVFRIGLVTEVISKLEQATGVVFGTVSQKTSKLNSANKRRRHHRSGSAVSMHSSAGSRTGSSESIGDRSSNIIRSSVTRGRRKNERPSVNPMSLALHSLPGISTFTDRAVIGMLKSFAGIHRDRKILNWNDDFRLGAGVGTFNISMIFGMDAGWAVEGAVGSEYKIDATYLSPHVNMASRMTSACKQYDVTIMLSQSVQELMSDVAQSKLRHLDTITVKGSSVKQKIFTYDAKARGVDFFLHSRSEEQADLEADRYSPGIWHNDQDLKAMRQHITDDFLRAFNEGFKAYTNGDWPTAIRKLEKANDIMFQTAVDEGYLEEEFDALNLRVGTDISNAAEELKRENVDGPSMYLINFMKSHGGEAPDGWEGWHPLTRK